MSQRLDDLKGFLAEHAEFLRGLAKVLRVVGVVLVVVGAVLAIFGVGAAVLTAGLVAGGVVAKLGAKLLERLGPRVRRLLGRAGGRLDDWTPGKPLPEAPAAAIDDAKFLKYSMDPGNPNNGGKWKAWSQLGYTVDDLTNRTAASDDVIRQPHGPPVHRLAARPGVDHPPYDHQPAQGAPVTAPPPGRRPP